MALTPATVVIDMQTFPFTTNYLYLSQRGNLRVTFLEPTGHIAERVQNISIYTVYIYILFTFGYLTCRLKERHLNLLSVILTWGN